MNLRDVLMNLLVTKLKKVFILLFFTLFLININNANADSHDQLSESLKQTLSNVINENLSEDLQKAIVKYVSAISQDISDDNKTTLLQSTKEMLSISSNVNINDFNQIYALLNNLEKIIDIIYPYMLDEMSNQNIPNNLQLDAWLAFSDLKTGIKNFDESQIKNSLKVISKALVADSITEADKEEAENETETENSQNNQSKIVKYNVDNKKETIGKVQKTGSKSFYQDDKQLKKRNNISTNSLLTCIESSTGCQLVLDNKTSFYFKNNTKIIINSYYVDVDGNQFIKACILEGGFYFKTLRKTNSHLTINIKNNGENYYDAIVSKGFDAKLGINLDNNKIDVVNAGPTMVSKIRFNSESADTKQENINYSNVENVGKMFETPITNILPSKTNSYGDPCINPNFGIISNKLQEIKTSTCSHAHAHYENGVSHEDDYDQGEYDLGENCDPDIVIPVIVCPQGYTCTLGGDDPKKPGGGGGGGGGGNNDAGEDHHLG